MKEKSILLVLSCLVKFIVSQEVSPTAFPTSGSFTCPTNAPSLSPTFSPALSETLAPSSSPSISPTLSPSLNPTLAPTSSPSTSPSITPTFSPSPSPTSLTGFQRRSLQEATLVSVYVHTASTFVLVFSVEVGMVGNSTFRCSDIFRYIFESEDDCTLRREEGFGLEFVFVDVNSVSLDLRERGDFESTFFLTAEKFLDPEGNFISLDESTSVVFPPQPVSSTSRDGEMILVFDSSVSLVGLSDIFYCRELFSLFLCPSEGPIDLMRDDYICTAELEYEDTIIINFETVMLFESSNYIFLPAETNYIRGELGIGIVYEPIEVVSKITEVDFDFTLTTENLLFPCHNEIHLILEQTSELPLYVEVDYAFSVVESDAEPIVLTRSGSLITSVQELFQLSPVMLAIVEATGELSFVVEMQVKELYQGSVIGVFREAFDYISLGTEIRASFRNGENIVLETLDAVKVKIDVEPVSSLCGIESGFSNPQELFEYSCWFEEDAEYEFDSPPSDGDTRFLGTRSLPSRLLQTSSGNSSEFDVFFPPGFSVVICEVSLNQDLESSAGLFPVNISLSALTFEPSAVIKLQAEKITVRAESEVQLSAARSCDPLYIGGELCDYELGYMANLSSLESIRDLGFSDEMEFSWNCENCFDELNVFFNISENPLEPLVSNLEPNETYIFSLEVFDGEARISELASIEVEAISVESCELPMVELSPLPKVINPGDYYIEAIVHNLQDLDLIEFQWGILTEFLLFGEVLVTEALDTSFITTTRAGFFVPSSILEPEVEYILEVNVTNICNNGAISIAQSQRRAFSNSPPTGGIVDVTAISSSTILQEYSVETGLWVDAEGDTPLEFSFEYAFLTSEESKTFIQNLSQHFSPARTIPLVPFSENSFLTLFLPVPPEGASLAVLAVARDSQGAVSERFGINAQFEIPTFNKFLDEEGNLRGDIDVGIVEDFLNSLILSGRIKEIPSVCSVIGSYLNQVSDSPNPTSAEIRVLCFSYSSNVLEKMIVQGKVDVLFLNQVADAYNSLTVVAQEISEQFRADFVQNVERLTIALINVVQKETDNFADPFSPNILANSVRESIFDVLSNSVNLIDVEPIELPPEPEETRILKQETSGCSVALGSENIFQMLSNLSNAVVPNGAAPYAANTATFQFLTVRERDREIGLENRVPGLNFTSSANSVLFGEALSSNADAIFGTKPQDVNIYAVNWNLDIRCDRAIVPNFNDTCNPVPTYTGPISGDKDYISNTLSVEILNRDSKLEKFSVTGVDGVISLVLDKHASSLEVFLPEECAEKSECGIVLQKETACGAYEDKLEDWVSSGCEAITDESTPPGTVLCICSHLSSYASWEAFKDDFTEIGAPIVCKSELGVTRSRFCSSMYILLSFFLLGWGFYDDKHDSKQLQKAAVARISLIKILQKHKKKNFFEAYERKLKQTSLASVENMQVTSEVSVTSKKYVKIFFINFLRSFKYEHSLLSMGKFDPNYSKFQRVAVFLTVVLANFALSAAFFNLTVEGDNLPIWLILLTGLVCALCVAIPIKIFIKALFRTTENFIGSVNDICANSTKILTRLEEGDGQLLPSDIQLADCYRELLWASVRLESGHRTLSANGLNTRVRPGSIPTQEGPFDEVVDDALRNPEPQIATEEHIEDLREQVHEATVIAREVWNSGRIQHTKQLVPVEVYGEKVDKSYSEVIPEDIPVAFYTMEWERILLADSQDVVNEDGSIQRASTFKRLAAIVADTASPKARSRSSRLPENAILLDWIVLAMIVLSLGFLSLDFVLGRFQDIAKEGDYSYQNISFIREIEDDEFYSWITASLAGIALSYFVAEPISLFFRFFVAPLYVAKAGNDELLKLPDENSDRRLSRTTEAMLALRQNRSFGSRATSFFIDYFADIFENVV
eukprot:snap_masked-scaffold_11-processed-gene-9.36-mRNA-1 protein AED:1.00 eAED:1.00 QI:0/-1/0/0/-1/1/1/0/1896